MQGGNRSNDMLGPEPPGICSPSYTMGGLSITGFAVYIKLPIPTAVCVRVDCYILDVDNPFACHPE